MKEPVIQAEFVCSATPSNPFTGPARPEFAFAGRSNAGKSSLINLLTGRKRLAHASATPGKTQTINYYLADNRWYLVDLPGYGYARRSKEQKKILSDLISHYVLNSPNLHCIFVLLDCRLPPQPADITFINWLGENNIPLALVLTKADKLSVNGLKESRARVEKALSPFWEPLPPLFITSSQRKTGREELLGFINQALANC